MKTPSTEMRDRYPEVEWHAMAGVRDWLVHGCVGVDYEILWGVATETAPKLRAPIGAIPDRE